MIKLYDIDSYIFKFSAVVVSCEEADGMYRVLLDQTAFFPTAGGQECDTGTINGIRVERVEIEDDMVCHYLKTPFSMGETVAGEIDKNVRMRKMRHHSAEHIVSGIIHSELGLENVGFHLGDDEVTMDYSGVITKTDLEKIERLANDAVLANNKISCEYPDEDTLATLDYRSKLELAGNVRIVTVPGVDVCACCAPHVAYTGEIGIIKLRDMINYKGGVRVRMICAQDALLDYEIKQENSVRISNLLSAKQDEIADSVEKLHRENAEWKQRYAFLEKQLVEKIAFSLRETDGNICVFERDLSVDALRGLANLGKLKCKGVFVGCAGNDKDGYMYIIASDGYDLNEACRKINSALSGRGGGRGDMVSGRFMCSEQEIKDFFHQYKLE